MSTGGQSKVINKVTLDTTPAESSIIALRRRIEEGLRGVTSTAQVVTGATGRRTKAQQDVPFTMAGGGEGVTRITAETMSVEESILDARKSVADAVKRSSKHTKQRLKDRQQREAQQIKDEDLFAKDRQKAVKDRVAAENRQERDENWLIRDRDKAAKKTASDTAAARREEISDRKRRFARRRRINQRRDAADKAEEAAVRKRGMDQSRRMMGVAGVATAAAMPISGFSPLTIGFASMSGIGFGIAAGVAVLGRAVFDINSILVKWREELIKSAEAAGTVTKAYKDQKARLDVLDLALGGSMAAASMLEMQRLQNARISRLPQLEQAGGVGKYFTGIFRGVGDIIRAEVGRALPFGETKSAEQILREGLANFLINQPFQSAFVGPEALNARIQQAAMSRGDVERERTIRAFEDNIKATIDNTETLRKITRAQELSDPLIFLPISPSGVAAEVGRRFSSPIIFTE
jgi:hypothetical protein